jgi:hypothetical protein
MSSSRDHAPTTSAATPKSAAAEAELSVCAAAQSLADELDRMASDRQAWAEHPEIGGKKPLFNSHLRGKRYGYSHAAQLIRSRLAIPEWRPIETAPKDGSFIMVWVDHPGSEFCPEPFARVDLAYWDEGTTTPGFERTPGWACHWIGTPTHWMPLPAPPQRVKEDA